MSKTENSRCVGPTQEVLICDKSGHLARDCRIRGQATEKKQIAAAIMEVKREITTIEPVVTSVNGLPVVAGKVG